MKELSIIVPVYNVEKYVFKCIDSIYQQDLDDNTFEIIIVDDGSEDNSIDIINSFVSQHNNIRIISQSNQGQSVARNKGLSQAEGILIMFLDSDDFLIPHSLRNLLDAAIEFKVDMVIADYVKKDDETICLYDIFQAEQKGEPILLKEKEALMKIFDPNQCFVWRTIYSKCFLEKNGLSFLPGVFFEDILFTSECYLKVKSALYFPLTFYVYRQHHNSTVSTVNKKKLLDLNMILSNLVSLQKSIVLSREEENKIYDLIFSTFSLEIWYLIHEKGLYESRNEIVRDLKNRVPDLCLGYGLKQYLTSILFKWMPFSYLKIRYMFR